MEAVEFPKIVTKSGDDKCILKAAGRGNTVVDCHYENRNKKL